MKKFVINESEKKRILSMHYKHYKNNLINEEGEQTPVTGGRLPCANSAEEITSGKALLYQGCKGNFVKELQERIASAGRTGSLTGGKMIGEKGAWGNPTDGIFGSRTKTAVIDFQKEMQLRGDGIVGKATWEKISAYKPEITFDVNSKGWIFKDTLKPVDSGWYSGKERSNGQMQTTTATTTANTSTTTATTTADTSTTTASTTASTANMVGNAAVQGAQQQLQQLQQNPELAQLVQQYQNRPKRRGIFGRRRR